MKISGFEQAYYFSNFKLNKERNEHSRCRFIAHISHKDIKHYLEKVGEEIEVVLEQHDMNAGGNKSEKIIFRGFISDVDARIAYADATVEVSSVSYSFYEDETLHTRIYQNTEKRFKDIANESKLHLEKCSLDYVGNIKEKELPQVILQHKESNFAFLKRLANRFKNGVWVKDTVRKTQILCAEFLGTIENRINEEKIVRFQKKKTINGYRSKITTKEYIELGYIVKVLDDPKSYLITSVNVQYIHGVLEYDYDLEEIKQNANGIECEKELQKSIRLISTVLKNDDPENMGRIQVSFDDIEDVDKDKPAWIEYRSPYAGDVGGIVFIPDIGDKVEVVFNNEEVYAHSTIRKKPLANECQNVLDKYIGNNTAQRVIWKKDSLEILSSDNSIILNKEKIQLSVGKSAVVMTEKNIYLQCGDNVLKIDENDISAIASKKIGLNAKNDFVVGINQKNKISVNSDINLDAGTINLKANDVKII